MDEFVNKVKKGATTIVDETGKIAKNVVEKSTSLIEQTKIKFAMSEISDKMNSEYIEIGKYVYEQYKEGAGFTDFVGEKCENLSKLDLEMEELIKQMAECKKSVVCKACSEINSAENKFCAFCGEKL